MSNLSLSEVLVILFIIALIWGNYKDDQPPY